MFSGRRALHQDWDEFGSVHRRAFEAQPRHRPERPSTTSSPPEAGHAVPALIRRRGDRRRRRGRRELVDAGRSKTRDKARGSAASRVDRRRRQPALGRETVSDVIPGSGGGTGTHARQRLSAGRRRHELRAPARSTSRTTTGPRRQTSRPTRFGSNNGKSTSSRCGVPASIGVTICAAVQNLAGHVGVTVRTDPKDGILVLHRQPDPWLGLPFPPAPRRPRPRPSEYLRP
jgi:hypothetical protein